MKKRWILTVIAATGGGVYAWKKFPKKAKKEEDFQRKSMVEHYENEGYKVHVYNENNDFMLFHHGKNEKRHVFYDDGVGSYEQFKSKLQAYYLHFTNEFYFVCKNEEVLEKTKQAYYEWEDSINEEATHNYGKTTGYFTTVDELLHL